MTLVIFEGATFLSLKNAYCAGPENIHAPPTKGIGISWGGGGFCKTKKFKEMCEALLEFPEGWEGGDLRKNPLCGGGMDIFWNYTLWHI